ncbi:bacterioferritin [Desulfovibrio sp. A2]|nr:bacterioferritin [Desulfovibrio sp. A2]
MNKATKPAKAKPAKPAKPTAAPSPREARKAKVIEVLNKARAMELNAITQYMNQHYGLDNMDYGELAANMKLIAIDEMRHAEMFAERIKELGGEPCTDRDGELVKGQDVRAIFPYDAGLEDDTIDFYNQFLLVCRENGDSISMKLFETIIEEEQTHFNYFDNVGEHLRTLGDTFLSKIAGTSASTGPSTKGFLISKGGAAAG